MKKLIALAAPLALALSPAVASAQSEKEEMAALENMGQMFQEMFVAEPLTAEQETRLPLASSIVALVIPDGTYARMMEDMIDPMLAPLVGMMPDTMPAAELSGALGVESYLLEDMEADQLARLSSIIDPQYSQRGEVGMRYMMEEMTSIFSEMEPALRSGMARAYAVRFDEQQLADISAFFATPTGSAYAAESFVVMADPQVMSASMEMMPVMFERLPDIMAGMEERLAQLPPARGFAQLSVEERREVASALGISVDELKSSMQSAD